QPDRGDGHAALRVTDLRVVTEVADQDHLVDATGHGNPSCLSAGESGDGHWIIAPPPPAIGFQPVRVSGDPDGGPRRAPYNSRCPRRRTSSCTLQVPPRQPSRCPPSRHSSPATWPPSTGSSAPGWRPTW